MGLASDFNFDRKEVVVKEVRYHAYVSTDEIIYKNYVSADEPTFMLEGHKMVLNQVTNSMKDFNNSPLTNLIGINLLVILKVRGETFVIVNKQSSYNDVNQSKLVPSASGSLEQSDFNVKQHYAITGQKIKIFSFQDLLKVGMYRELMEESYLTVDNCKGLKEARFLVLGYSRLFSKAGKPDFFGACIIENDAVDIEKIKSDFNENQNQSIGKKDVESAGMNIMPYQDFLNDSLDNFSAQLSYMQYLLKNNKWFNINE